MSEVCQTQTYVQSTHVLMSEGQTRSLGTAFTSYLNALLKAFETNGSLNLAHILAISFF
jgi:hypothetical protein